MLACSFVLTAALAGCGSDYDAPAAYVPPPVTQAPVVTPSAQFIGVVGSTITTANADLIEPAAVDAATAPTTDTEEPVPVS
jgi:hypothetical protein